MANTFIYVVIEGKDHSNSKKYKTYACDYAVVTLDSNKFDDFMHDNPFWVEIWTDLYGTIMPLDVPVIEMTDYDEIEQALNFVVTFMHQDPYETLSYINRVWVFRENDTGENSLLASFFELQLNYVK